MLSVPQNNSNPNLYLQKLLFFILRLQLLDKLPTHTLAVLRINAHYNVAINLQINQSFYNGKVLASGNTGFLFESEHIACFCFLVIS